MSRNGTGTMSIPNTFIAGTVITSSDENENFSDIASEITNSVAADGQTTMTGPLKATSGTLAAPSYAFGADTNTGRYRKSADTMADVCGGVEIVEISSTGIDVTGAIKQNGAAISLPSGFGPCPWSGLSAPSGWVLVGATYSRATYASLWAFAEAEIALGNDFYTNGDGSTTFGVGLDMPGRVPACKEATATLLTTAGSGVDGGTFGAVGGAQTHTLTTAQAPSGLITLTDPGHIHKVGGNTLASSGSSIATITNYNASASQYDSQSVTTGITLTDNGGNAAHPNAQPTIIVNYIIKT